MRGKRQIILNGIGMLYIAQTLQLLKLVGLHQSKRLREYLTIMIRL